MDVTPEYNGGPGGELVPVQCPICHKDDWAKAPEVLWTGTDAPGSPRLSQARSLARRLRTGTEHDILTARGWCTFRPAR